MSEYIEREAAVEALARLCKRVCQYSEKQRQYMCGACPLGDAFTVIEDDLPAADVRPVVLCRDCRHRDPEDHKCDCGQLERAGCVFPVDDDYFCAYGER